VIREVEALLERASDLYLAYDFEGALREARRVLAMEPGNGEALDLCARCLQELGSLEEAETHARSAIACAPESADYLANLGDILHDAGRLDEAVEVFRLALTLLVPQTEFRRPGIASSLAECLADVGQYEEALGLLKDSLEVSRGSELEEHLAQVQDEILARREKCRR